MQRQDFDYTLPPEQIAQHAIEPRSAARMLCVGATDLHDATVAALPQQLRPDDLVVFNDTRVIAARLYAVKATGGRAEIFIERLLDTHGALAQLRVSKALPPGGRLAVEGDGAGIVAEGREGRFYRLRFDEPVLAVLERAGHVPLPPYIRRPDEAHDRERYQTLFAREPGAVAAPTASLHFDAPLLAAIRARGATVATLTLHVGTGTFQPVQVDDLAAHVMHAERYQVSAELAAAVAETRARGGRVVAVGTTVVRALESAVGVGGELAVGAGETRLFITPGYRFGVVDALLTNFHLPQSTLLMLVSAFGGHARVMAAYRHAVAQGYRFFSYGDAMWLPQRFGD